VSKCELQEHPPKETEKGAQIFGPGVQPSNTFPLQKCGVSHGALQKSKWWWIELTTEY